DAGTAIEGITGDISVMNNLLLKLKRSVGLNSLPSFPTPLTQIVFTSACECSGDGEGTCPVVEQLDVTGATFGFNMVDECRKLFLGSADIDGLRTWTFTAAEEAAEFLFSFVITGLVTMGDATHDQTLPSNVKMSDARVVPGS